MQKETPEQAAAVPPKPAPRWSSRYTFLMASIGAAVGLANLWRFPFQVGQNGGSAFVFVYLLCVFFIAYPVLMAELAIGRHTGSVSAVGAIRGLAVDAGHSARWVFAAWLGFVVAILVLPVYSVIGGQIMAYSAMSFLGEFAQGAGEPSLYSDALSKGFWFSIFIALNVFIVSRGLKKGIEAAVSVLMPLFCVMLVGLCIYALITGAAGAAFAYLFTPRFSQLTPDVVLAALGQALYSVSVGATIMITYGAYLKREYSIPANAAVIAGTDTLVAILAGLMIFPIVFAQSFDPGMGMSLIFETLPFAFASITGGALVGGFFFFLAFVAALTSSISMLMISTAVSEEHFGLKKMHAALIFGALAWCVGMASIMSETLGIQIDFIVSNVLLPVGAFSAALLAGWVAPRAFMRDQFRGVGEGVFDYWRFLVRYIAPCAIMLIFILGLDAKFGWGLNAFWGG